MKWLVTETYALLFDEVQRSMVKEILDWMDCRYSYKRQIDSCKCSIHAKIKLKMVFISYTFSSFLQLSYNLRMRFFIASRLPRFALGLQSLNASTNSGSSMITNGRWWLMIHLANVSWNSSLSTAGQSFFVTNMMNSYHQGSSELSF